MWLKSFLRRVRGLWLSETIHQEITDELQFHIDMRVEENIRRGMSPDEARRAAERSFGDLTRVKEQGYDMRGGQWLETVWQDLRCGARMLLKNPGFTTTAVLTLTLGISANTATFSVVNAVLLRPLPYEDPGQLVRLWADNSGQRTEQNPFAPAEITDFRDHITAFEAIGLFDIGLSANLTGGAQPERVNGS